MLWRPGNKVRVRGREGGYMTAFSITYTPSCWSSMHAHTGPAPSIPRLGINPYQWGTECLSGDVRAGPATSFPQAIGLVSDVM